MFEKIIFFYLESIFNMDVPPVRERVLPGVQNVSSMTKKKLLDVATSTFCGGKLRPLSNPSDFSDRQIKTLEQIEYLVKNRNNGSFLRSNWPDLVEISITREELAARPTFYKLYSSENFVRQPEFIFEAKNSALREIFLKKIDDQFSILLQWSFFHRFLYKLSIIDADEEVENKDTELERISGFSRVHEDIFMPEILEQIKQVLKANFFCSECVQKFDKLDQILPHFQRYHRSFISNESVEARQNARESRRREERDDQLRNRHNDRHPDCNSCFVDRQ